MDTQIFLRNVRQQLFLDTLRQTQFLPRAQLLAYQNQLLTSLLRHALAQVPFYADRLSSAFGPDGTVRMDAFAKLPILTRTEAQENSEALTARDLPPSAGTVQSGATSGSTGQAFTHKRNAMADIASACMTARSYEWSGIDQTGTLADIRYDRTGQATPPHGMQTGRWNLSAARTHGYFLGIEATIEEQLDWLMLRRADHLMTYPSNARALAEAARDRELDLRFRHFLSISETLDDETRNLCANVFECRVTDNYGCQEIGLLALECPECGEYHECSESVLIELLDDHDQPVGPGQIGRVVVTSLYNYAMPFIRYEIGDYAMAGREGVTCSRTLPRFARIMGRSRNMFRFPGGRTIWPNAFNKEVERFLPIRQTQFVQVAPLEILLRYTRNPNGAETDMERLVAFLRERLDPRISVRVEEVQKLERSAGGKYEDYVSLVSGTI